GPGGQDAGHPHQIDVADAGGYEGAVESRQGLLAFGVAGGEKEAVGDGQHQLFTPPHGNTGAEPGTAARPAANAASYVGKGRVVMGSQRSKGGQAPGLDQGRQ